MDMMQDDDFADVMRALGHPVRLSILRILAEKAAKRLLLHRRDAVPAAGAVDASASTSRCCSMPGWSSGSPKGTRNCYSLRNDRLASLEQAFSGLFAGLVADHRRRPRRNRRRSRPDGPHRRARSSPTVDAEESISLRTARQSLGLYVAGRAAGPQVARRSRHRRADRLSKVATTLVPFAYKGIIDGLSKAGGHRGAGHRALRCRWCWSSPMASATSSMPASSNCATCCSPASASTRSASSPTGPSSTCTGCRCASIWRGAPAGCRRVIERGTKGIETIVRFTMLNTAPTLLEFVFVGGIFVYHVRLAAICGVLVVTVVALYLVHRARRPNWRITIRRDMNDSDTDANTKAIDSLLNFETVKYFGNEKHGGARASTRSMAALRARGDPHLDLARRSSTSARRSIFSIGLTVVHGAWRRCGVRRRHADDRRLRADQRAS